MPGEHRYQSKYHASNEVNIAIHIKSLHKPKCGMVELFTGLISSIVMCNLEDRDIDFQSKW